MARQSWFQDYAVSPQATSRSSSRPATGRADGWNSTVDQRCNTAPPAGGLLGRFENTRQRPSGKRIVPCTAATPEYYRHEFLRPGCEGFATSPNCTWTSTSNHNYHPTSDLHETKFHKGFQRRMKADIQSDAARMEVELAHQLARDRRDLEAIEIAKAMKERATFNILTGEGVGRECEYRPLGKRIVNPFGCMEAVFAEHARDTSNRTLQSRHRFFEIPGGSPNDARSLALYHEGFSATQRQAAMLDGPAAGMPTQRQAAILGTPAAGMPARTRVISGGVADNFRHLRRPASMPALEAPPPYTNRSQVSLG